MSAIPMAETVEKNTTDEGGHVFAFDEGNHYCVTCGFQTFDPHKAAKHYRETLPPKAAANPLDAETLTPEQRALLVEFCETEAAGLAPSFKALAAAGRAALATIDAVTRERDEARALVREVCPQTGGSLHLGGYYKLQASADWIIRAKALLGGKETK